MNQGSASKKLYTPDDDATELDKFLTELAQWLCDSGDENKAQELATAATYLREIPNERLGVPYAQSAYDKLEIIADSANAAIEIIKSVTGYK